MTVTPREAQEQAAQERAERRRRAGPVTAALRARVVGTRHRCPECKRWFRRLTLDHKRAVRFGGTTTEENAAPLCRSCNSSKADGTRGPPRRCVGCQRMYRRARGAEDGRCDDCRRRALARGRREAEAAIRKRASAWRRERDREARARWRALRKGRGMRR